MKLEEIQTQLESYVRIRDALAEMIDNANTKIDELCNEEKEILRASKLGRTMPWIGSDLDSQFGEVRVFSGDTELMNEYWSHVYLCSGIAFLVNLATKEARMIEASGSEAIRYPGIEVIE